MLPFLQNIYAPKHVETKPPETETPKPVKIKKIIKRVKIPINNPEDDLEKAENLKKLELEQSQLQLKNAISNEINKIGRKKREISDFDSISDSNTSEENLAFETTKVVEEGTADNSEKMNQDQSYLESAADPVIDNPEIESPIEYNSDLVYPKPTNPDLVYPEPTNPEPVNPEPHNPEPVNQELVNQEPVNQEHVDEEPVNPEPVNSEPVNPEPVNTELVTPETVNPESLIPESVDFQLTAPETIAPINSYSETSLPNPEEPSSESNQVMVNPIQDEKIEDASLLPGRL
jgi:hypothetical protein